MKKLSILIAAAIMMLTAYPVIELTRCIYEYGIRIIHLAESDSATVLWLGGFQPTLDIFYRELALIWGFYLCVPVVTVVALIVAYDMGRTGGGK